MSHSETARRRSQVIAAEIESARFFERVVDSGKPIAPSLWEGRTRKRPGRVGYSVSKTTVGNILDSLNLKMIRAANHRGDDGE